MTDQLNTQDVPPGVMDLLRIFLAASSRGEEAALILETRRKVISSKFRSVESTAGVPAAPTNNSLARKKKNPARARRSRLRLEAFMKRKVEGAGLVQPCSWNLYQQHYQQAGHPVGQGEGWAGRIHGGGSHQPHSSSRWSGKYNRSCSVQICE